MSDEVAVFVDIENLRYGLLNHYGIEPDFKKIVEKAQTYGRPSLMRAYADFSEHPPGLNRRLEIAGIEAINIPVKRYVVQRGAASVERIKNAADMVLALDALLEAVEADTHGKKKTFLVVTGDRDYVKLVTQIKNRFGQHVVIVGVPGSTSSDLVTAAGQEDPIEVPDIPRVDMHILKTAIVEMVKRGPSPLRYWSMRVVDEWCQDGRQKIPGTAKERRDGITALKTELVLVPKELKDDRSGRTVTEVILDEEKARSLKYLK